MAAVARSLLWSWQVLGVLLGAATTISIIKNGFAIDVYGLPAKVLAQYVWLRDTLLGPLLWAVRYFGLEMAWWVKDMIVAYGLVAAAHARADEVINRPVDEDSEYPPDDPPSRGERIREAARRVGAAALWPRTTGRLLQEWVEGRADREYFARYARRNYPHMDPDLYVRVTTVHGRSPEGAAEHLKHIALQVVAISVVTMAFFLWNYLSGLYGLPT